jgi:hypothetical protein
MIPEGRDPHPIPKRSGGLTPFQKPNGGGVEGTTPLLKNENHALLHGSPATSQNDISDDVGISGRYSILITGVRSGQWGGGWYRLPPASTHGGVTPLPKTKRWGGREYHPRLSSLRFQGNGSSIFLPCCIAIFAMARSWMARPVESKMVIASGPDRRFFPITTSPSVPAISSAR